MKKVLYLFIVLSLLSCGSKKRSVSKKRIGAVCNDGWRSNATGSGACSHHGGVNYWVYEKN